MQIGLFYGSTTCYTEMAAEKIRDTLNEAGQSVTLFNIRDEPLVSLHDFDMLILGISTWDFGELQEDWESHWDELTELDLSGKTVALFGLGDQQGYGEWFQDALGMLHDVVLTQGARVIGYWPNQGYEFTASKALVDNEQYFVGLALDDENQWEQSDARIAQWCEQLLSGQA